MTEYDNLLADAAARCRAYLNGIRDRGVAPAPESIAAMSRLGETLPVGSTDARQVLALLDDFGSPATVANAGGRFFGFVNGGSLPATVAANWLAASWDQNAAMRVESPVGAYLEDVALGWLIDVLNLPAGCAAGFVSGATMANFTALAAARHALLARQGWDVESRGLFGAPAITVIVGNEVHVSLLKALAMLGLGRDRVVRVPADSQGRMIAEELPSIQELTIVCLQAGNVNTGAFDPAGDICAAAHSANGWVHVDGAFGLWAAASPALRHLAEGFSLADSWATDAHKWLNVPYDSGLAFVRDGGAFRAAMTARASYLQSSPDREPMDYTPESSRRARGVEVWTALLSLGRSGLAELIDRTCRHAARFADGLRDAGYSILNDVVLNQVLVSFGDPATTRRVIEAVQAEGTCWCGATVWQEHTAMRISVSNWATTEEDVERSLEAILRLAAGVRRNQTT